MMLLKTLPFLGFMATATYAIDANRAANTFDAMAELSLTTDNAAVELSSDADTLNRYFPAVIVGFALITTSAQNEVIVNSAESSAQKRQNAAQLPPSDQNKICVAFANFVSVHTSLLNVIIGKKSSLQAATGADVHGDAGRLLNNLAACSDAVTALFQQVESQIPNCANNAKEEKQLCDETIQQLEATLRSL